MLRPSILTTLIGFVCFNSALCSRAAADIILTATADVSLTETEAIVTYNLFGGSSSASTVGVAKYQVDVELASLTPHLASPLSLSSLIFANAPSPTSVWSTASSGSAAFGGSPGGISGSVVTFTGDVGDPFAGNVQVTPHAEDTQHRLGSIVMRFLRPADADLHLSLPPLNANFEAYDLKFGLFGTRPLTETISGTTFVVNRLDVVPEPGGLLMLASLLAGCCFQRRRREFC